MKKKTSTEVWHRIADNACVSIIKSRPVVGPGLIWSTLEELNASQRKHNLYEYSAFDVLNDEEQRALDMLEWERQQSTNLLRLIIEHVQAGHYTDDLLSQIIRVPEMEFGERGAAALAAIKALPPRTTCGAIECWCLAAMNNFGFARMGQLRSKEAIFKKIEERFATAEGAE